MYCNEVLPRRMGKHVMPQLDNPKANYLMLTRSDTYFMVNIMRHVLFSSRK